MSPIRASTSPSQTADTDTSRDGPSKPHPQEAGCDGRETAASAGSSLGLFALITAAGRAELEEDEANAIESVYWPWGGALHSLLDSLLDANEDAHANQRNLTDYYKTTAEATARLRMLATHALHAADALANADEHSLILASMASYYLAGHRVPDT